MSIPRVIGLGSHHGDDQAGWLVIDRLRERLFPHERLNRILHPADLLEVAEKTDALIICDACAGEGAAGKIDRWRWPAGPAVSTRHSGSHDLNLYEVLELGRQLDCLPESVEIWTIQGSMWMPGSQPSAAVQRAAGELAESVTRACADA